MRNRLCFVYIILYILLTSGWNCILYAEDTDTMLWKKVAEAEQDQLPLTTIKLLQSLYQRAWEKNEYPTALKAKIKLIIQQSAIEGSFPEYKIRLLEKEIVSAPPALQPLYYGILGLWYHQYYQANRYRILQRTPQEGQNAEDDITLWDIDRIYAKTVWAFKKSLSGHEIQKIPIDDWLKFLAPGSALNLYRPSLFDFLSWEFIDFLSNGDWRLTKPIETFDIIKTNDFMKPLPQFNAWTLPFSDTLSPNWLLIKTFKELINFHQNDIEALIHADIHRISTLKNLVPGASADSLYLHALQYWLALSPRSEQLPQIAYFIAQIRYQKGDAIQAHALCQRYSQAWPGTVGANNCLSLIDRIEAKELTIKTKTLRLPRKTPALGVQYRNIDRITFRVYRDSWDTVRNNMITSQEINDSMLWRYLKNPPLLEWSIELNANSDFHLRDTLLDLPAIEPGCYRIFASYQPTFERKSNQISHTPIIVTPYFVYYKTQQFQPPEAYINDYLTGTPIKGLQVKIQYYQKGKTTHIVTGEETLSSDRNGYVQLPKWRENESFRIIEYLDSKGNRLIERQNHQSQITPANRIPSTPSAIEQVVLFSDRKLYRPGQTIYFKGILFETDPVKNDYHTLENQTVQVELLDRNRSVVQTLELKTNALGSFSGTYQLPVNLLLGVMEIRTTEPQASASIRVEEYKRPTFYIETDPINESYKVNDTVRITGTAVSYSGAPIDGGKVTYRVFRQTSYPIWRYRWIGFPRDNQELAFGEIFTDREGKFNFNFQALPNPKIDPSNDPVFSYSITISITDIQGETQQHNKSINAGYSLWQAYLSLAEWNMISKPCSVKIEYTNLNGQPVAAEGEVLVYRLIQPQETRQFPDFQWRQEPIPSEVVYDTSANDWQRWPNGEIFQRIAFRNSPNRKTIKELKLPSGAYRVVIEARDPAGKIAKAEQCLLMIDPRDKKFPLHTPFYCQAKSNGLKVGDTLSVLCSSGADKPWIRVELFRDGQCLEYFKLAQSQSLLQVPVTEKMRGGFTIHVNMVLEEEWYPWQTRIDIPWDNKKLVIKPEHLRTNLLPGKKEIWKLRVQSPQNSLPVEMVAGMYDSSLDLLAPHSWPTLDHVFSSDHTVINYFQPIWRYDQYSYRQKNSEFRNLLENWNRFLNPQVETYPQYPPEVHQSYGFFMGDMLQRAGNRSFREQPSAFAADAFENEEVSISKLLKPSSNDNLPAPPEQAQTSDDNDRNPLPSIRRNLRETAFFYPQLLADSAGFFILQFEMPEALTSWRLMAFAHNRELTNGYWEEKIITQKPLMIQPNLPRFLREGDRIVISAKISNLTDQPITGEAVLTLFDPFTEKTVTHLFAIQKPTLDFTVESKRSTRVEWSICVPRDVELAAVRISASDNRFSDGEESLLPILKKSILVQESIPLWVNDTLAREFHLIQLEQSQDANIQHQSLTLEITQSPLWTAVKALPVLMEANYENAEQLFNRLFANLLARKIVAGSPRIGDMFRQWQKEGRLKSELELDTDLKSILLEETPWALESRDQTESVQRIALLFDVNYIESSISSTFDKLKNLQNENGCWPWFKGGPDNTYMTVYLVANYGRIKKLGIQAGMSGPFVTAINYLDQWLIDRYQEMLRDTSTKDPFIGSLEAFYLYGRTFYLLDRPLTGETEKAFNYFIKLAKKSWAQTRDRLTQAYIALALWELEQRDTSLKICRSLLERSRYDEELGRYWADTEAPWYWAQEPLETQVMMIEALEKCAQDTTAAHECRQWLLKLKQTHSWPTTKSTAAAVFALLSPNQNLPLDSSPIDIKLGLISIDSPSVESGTNMIEYRVSGDKIHSEMGRVRLHRKTPGISWGGLHWQYWQEMDKIAPHTQNPLKIKRTLWIKKNSAQGPTLIPLNRETLALGDHLVIRLELETDRSLEFIHIKDNRAAGVECVDQLSSYHFQDGLYYYQSNRDTAAHFFIDYLPKGRYIFEYETTIVQKGSYSGGISHIECMYAPEFNAHSQSQLIQAP